MKRSYFYVLPLVMMLSGCSHTVPKSCLSKDPYPRPQSVCSKSDPIKVGAIPHREPLQARTGKRSLADILLNLIDTNPDIGIAGAKEKEQNAGIMVAKAAGRPTVDLYVSGGPQQIFWPEPAGDAMRKEASVSVRQVLYDFGAIKSDVKRAQSMLDSATSGRIAKTEEIALDMLNAFLDVRQADEMISVTRDNIAAHQNILNLVELREQNGNGTVADVKRITTRLESSKAALIDLTTKRADAVAKFENIAQTDVDDIDASVLTRLKGDAEKIDMAIIEKNPSIVALQQEISAIEYQLASVKAEKLPVFGLQATAKASQNVSSPEDGDNQLSVYGLVTMRVSVFDGGLNDGKQAQIRSRLEMTRLKLEKERRSLWEDAQNVQRVTSSDGARSGSLEERVAASKKVADLNLEQFKNGAKSVFELLDGQADYFKAKGELIEQDYNRKKAQIRALQLRGELVLGLLGLSPRQTPQPVIPKTLEPTEMQGLVSLPGVKARS
jgi:adhesin transport system outer membrane protein